MMCAVCHERVHYDGPLGFVHEDGTVVAGDGHTVHAIREVVPPQPW